MSYKFEEAPNYKKLKFLLRKILIENGLKPTSTFVFDAFQQSEPGCELGSNGDEGSTQELHHNEPHQNQELFV